MAMADVPSTVIVNHTKKDLDMKVGNHQYFADFTSVRSGAQHTMRIDFNDTYQEFLIGVAEGGKRLIVTSDDCCDYKSITITEVDGHLSVHKVPRRRTTPPKPPGATTPDGAGRRRGQAAKKPLRLRKVPVKKMKVLFNWGLMCQ